MTPGQLYNLKAWRICTKKCTKKVVQDTFAKKGILKYCTKKVNKKSWTPKSCKKIVTKKLYVPTIHHADKCARETLKELVTWIGLKQLRKPEERVAQCGKSLWKKEEKSK